MLRSCPGWPAREHASPEACCMPVWASARLPGRSQEPPHACPKGPMDPHNAFKKHAEPHQAPQSNATGEKCRNWLSSEAQSARYLRCFLHVERRTAKIASLCGTLECRGCARDATARGGMPLQPTATLTWHRSPHMLPEGSKTRIFTCFLAYVRVLPCLLQGLQKSPQFTPRGGPKWH